MTTLRESSSAVADIQRHNFNESIGLTSVHYAGEPCWFASEVGEALGYSGGGGKLSERIRGRWSDDFIEGTDFHYLEGPNLRELKEVLRGTPKVGGALKYTSQAILLTETGIDMALVKTRKPIGQALRRWLVSDVLPSIRATGEYRVEEPQAETRRPTLPESADALNLRRAELSLEILRDLEARNVDQDVVASCKVMALELALGNAGVRGLLPTTTETAHWYTTTEIAQEVDLHPSVVGRIARREGVQGDRRYWRLGTQQTTGGRTVDLQLYNEEGKNLIVLACVGDAA